MIQNVDSSVKTHLKLREHAERLKFIKKKNNKKRVSLQGKSKDAGLRYSVASLTNQVII
jgi:hypothetical protein